MKPKPALIRRLVEDLLDRGKSHREVAVELGLPKGTVATWSRRRKSGDMKAGMKAGPAKVMASDMKAAMKAGLATFRGVTAVDLPGKTRADQSMNFMMLKRGQYPPRSAGIPGTLEGAALLEALKAWCEGKGKRRAGA
jgi:hypothetical protein